MTFTDALFEAVAGGDWVVLPGSRTKFRAFGSIGNIKREWPNHDPVPTGLTVVALNSESWQLDRAKVVGPTLGSVFPELTSERESRGPKLSELFGLSANGVHDRLRISDLLRI
jgi:hypothetical protein